MIGLEAADARTSGLGRKPEPVIEPEVVMQKSPAGKRGRKPGPKNAKPAEAEATADLVAMGG